MKTINSPQNFHNILLIKNLITQSEKSHHISDPEESQATIEEITVQEGEINIDIFTKIFLHETCICLCGSLQRFQVVLI